jgi:hypothetical protein
MSATGGNEKALGILLRDVRAKDENGEVNFKSLQTLRKDWTRYVADKLRKNEPIPIEDFGVDGIRNITKYIVQSHIPYSFIKAKGGRKKLKEINDRLLDLRYGLAQKTTREYKRIKILINEFKSLS